MTKLCPQRPLFGSNCRNHRRVIAGEAILALTGRSSTASHDHGSSWLPATVFVGDMDLPAFRYHPDPIGATNNGSPVAAMSPRFLEPAGRAEISVQYPQIEGAPMTYVVHELEIQRRETLDAVRASRFGFAGVLLEINLIRIRAATSARIAARLPSFSAMRCNDRRALWNK
jgi:hypothetical protein